MSKKIDLDQDTGSQVVVDSVPLDVRAVHVEPHDVGTGGHLKKNMSMLAIIGFGLEVSNGWSGISGTLAVGLAQGGAVTILYGLLFTGLMNVFIAMTLAELSSAMPSAGGQYVWSSVLAPRQYRRQISFLTGCVSIFAWIVISGTVFVIIGQYVMSLVQLFHPAVVIQTWHIFLIYLATLCLSVLWNIFLAVKLPWVGTAFIYFSIITFLSIVIACAARAETYQSNTFVWKTYTNEIGWTSPFVVVITGLINPAYCFLGLDSTVHIAEDSIRPARDVPLGLLFTVLTSFMTAFSTAVVLLYCIQDVDAALGSYVPFLTIMAQATRSNAAAAVLLIFTIFAFIGAGNACLHACSRLLWSFASDGALPYERHLKHINPTLNVPIVSIVVPAIPVAVVGILYLVSTTAYNSIVGTAIILSYLSFVVPTACLMLGGRRHLAADRWFNLGVFGWLANAVVIIWCLFASIMWLFPLTSAPTGSSMNYAVVILGIMGVLSVLDWVFYARNHFRGPTVEDWNTEISRGTCDGREETVIPVLG